MLCNVPATFERLMEQVLHGLPLDVIMPLKKTSMYLEIKTFVAVFVKIGLVSFVLLCVLANCFALCLSQYTLLEGSPASSSRDYLKVYTRIRYM